MPAIGIAITLALFALLWAVRDKLNTMGLEYVHWNRTPAVWIGRAAALGVGAAAATAWWFRGYDMGRQPPFAEVLIAVSWGPLLEEVIFRGYLFSLLERFLKSWLSSPGWLIVVGIAAAFALSHLVKIGITPIQLATVFFTGTIYGWLRLVTGSTVPPVCSHISYNSVIYLAAAFFR